MGITELLNRKILFLDGGFGTYLQKEGLRPGENTESWNLTHPQVVQSVHKKYFDAGSNIVCANTFGANSLKYAPDELEQIIKAAVDNAVAAKNG